MPQEYYGDDPTIYKVALLKNTEGFSPDGLFTADGAKFREVVLKAGDAINLMHGVHSVRVIEDMQCGEGSRTDFEEFLELLGWEVSKGKKSKGYAAEFSMLGIVVDFTTIAEGHMQALAFRRQAFYVHEGILSWGTHAKVVRPERLRESLHQTVASLLKAYSSVATNG